MTSTEKKFKSGSYSAIWLQSPSLERTDELLMVQFPETNKRNYYTYDEIHNVINTKVRPSDLMNIFKEFVGRVDQFYANRKNCCRSDSEYGLF
jgi:hypothetical protein